MAANDSDYFENSFYLPEGLKDTYPLKEEKVQRVYIRSVVSIGLVAFSLPLFLYTYFNRSLADIVFYTLTIALPLSALIILSGLNIASQFQKYRWRQNTVNVVILAITILFFALLFYCAGVIVRDFFFFVFAPDSWAKHSIFFATTSTLIIGIFLFLFRLRLRGIYGITEVLIGLTVSANKVETNSHYDYAFYLAMLTAGVYLVVRGLDNFHYGITKKHSDPVIEYLYLKFKTRFFEPKNRREQKRVV